MRQTERQAGRQTELFIYANTRIYDGHNNITREYIYKQKIKMQ